jgi:AAA domain
MKRKNWVGWRSTPGRPDPKTGITPKPRKLPISVITRSGRDWGNPENHTTYVNAAARIAELKLSGVGFVLTLGCGLIGVDLDNCRNPDTGEIAEWAQAIIDLAETYAEISPSGKGVRVWIKGELASAIICERAGIEIYSGGRYLTFTGDHIPGTPDDVFAAPKTFAALQARVDEIRAEDLRNVGAGSDTDTSHADYRDTPHGKINQLALKNPKPWFTEIFPGAQFYPTAKGGYWRAGPEDLCRPDLQESLSVHPDGIMDWGVHDQDDINDGKRTAINVVIEWGLELEFPTHGKERADALREAFDDPENMERAVRQLAGQLGYAEKDLAAMGFRWAGGEPDPDDGPLDVVCPTIFQGKKAPPQRWICPDWIPYDVVTGLYGDGGTGKSLLALQLQTALALSGATWLGLPLTDEEIISFGVYCEDKKQELQRREEKINAACFTDFNALGRMHWVSRLGMDNLLMTFGSRSSAGQLTRFHKLVLEQALDLRARLVTIDTAADTFGGNENDRNQVRQYVQRALGSIALKIDGAVVCCAHPSLSGVSSGTGTSGSTGWSNAFRSRLYLTHIEDDPNARLLQRKKANYAKKEDELRLRWVNGVMVQDGMGGPGVTGTGAPVSAVDVFLNLVRLMDLQGRPVSSISSRAHNYAPREFDKLLPEQKCGFREKDFRTAMERLLASGKIYNVDYVLNRNKGRKIAIRKDPAEDDPI